jgi:tyrosyl-tRNA synthetase
VGIGAAELAAGVGVLSAFVHAGLVPSTGEARRQIQSGGLRINDAVVTDARATLTAADAVNDGAIKLSFGKKKHVLLRAG